MHRALRGELEPGGFFYDRTYPDAGRFLSLGVEVSCHCLGITYTIIMILVTELLSPIKYPQDSASHE